MKLVFPFLFSLFTLCSPAIALEKSQTSTQNENNAYPKNYCLDSNTQSEDFLKKIDLTKPETLSPFQLLFLKNHKQYLLKKIINGFDINSCGPPMDSSLLGLASYFGEVGDVKLIISHGANIDDPRTPKGESPIILSIISNRYEVSNILIKQGADINATYGYSYKYSTLDALAESYKDKNYDAQKELELAVFLIKSGLSPNKKDENPHIEKTPLLRAVASNKPSLVEFFLKNGGDPYIKGNNGKDSVDVAKSLNREEIIKILQEGGYAK